MMGEAVRHRDVVAALGDHDLRDIARRIREDGFACVENVFSNDEVGHALEQAVTTIERARGQYIAVAGGDGLEGVILGGLSSSSPFLGLCHRLCVLQGIGTAHDETAKQVLRCLSGTTGLGHAYYFHFDSFELTALIPIAIPTAGRAGDLLMFPNFRPRRSSYLLNIVEKFLFERRAVQSLVKRRALRSRRVLKLRLRPGNLYFFNGNRSLHANEDCDPAVLRATLLIHYAQTHRDHWLRRARHRRRSSA